jgi:DNA-directed RNA polymerase specialized sigma24 family protein
MQDAFLKLWERWDRIDLIDDPRSYLFRVVLNGFRMRTRAARRAARRKVAPYFEPQEAPADWFDEDTLVIAPEYDPSRPDTEGPGSQMVAGPSVLQSDGGSRPTF